MNKLVIVLGVMAIFATCYAGEAKLGRRIRTVASPDGEDLDTAQSGWGGGGYRGFGGGGYGGGLGGFGGGGYGGGYGGYGGGGYGGGGYGGGGYGGGGWGR